jgi:hypothetical protein
MSTAPAYGLNYLSDLTRLTGPFPLRRSPKLRRSWGGKHARVIDPLPSCA